MCEAKKPIKAMNRPVCSGIAVWGAVGVVEGEGDTVVMSPAKPQDRAFIVHLLVLTNLCLMSSLKLFWLSSWLGQMKP